MNIHETLAEDTGNSIFEMLAGTLDIITPDNIRNYVPQYAVGIHADIADLILSTSMATTDWTITQEGTALVFKYKNGEKWRVTI